MKYCVSLGCAFLVIAPFICEAQELPRRELRRVNDSGDGGLLGLAFHPEHATPGKIPTVVVTEASQPLEPPALLQNFSNPFFPFNPYTLIPFTVAEDGWVEVIVFDLLGRQVRILTEGLMPAGRHAVL